MTQPCAGYFDSRMAMFRRSHQKNTPRGGGGHRNQVTLSGFIEASGCGEISVWYQLEQLHNRAMPISKPMNMMERFRSRIGEHTLGSEYLLVY